MSDGGVTIELSQLVPWLFSGGASIVGGMIWRNVDSVRKTLETLTAEVKGLGEGRARDDARLRELERRVGEVEQEQRRSRHAANGSRHTRR